MLRLPMYRLFPVKLEPSKIPIDAGLELQRAVDHVDVSDAQQHPPAGRGRYLLVDQRRQRIAKIQLAIQARCKAKDRSSHERFGFGLNGCFADC